MLAHSQSLRCSWEVGRQSSRASPSPRWWRPGWGRPRRARPRAGTSWLSSFWLFFVAWRSSRVWCKDSLGTFYIHPAVRWPEARHRDAKACYLLWVISLLGILKIWRGRQTLPSRCADQARVKVFCRRCCLGKELIVIQFLSFSSEIPTKDMRECTSIQLLSLWWNCTVFIQHLFKQGFWDACLPLTPFFYITP